MKKGILAMSLALVVSLPTAFAEIKLDNWMGDGDFSTGIFVGKVKNCSYEKPDNNSTGVASIIVLDEQKNALRIVFSKGDVPAGQALCSLMDKEFYVLFSPVTKDVKYFSGYSKELDKETIQKMMQ